MVKFVDSGREDSKKKLFLKAAPSELSKDFLFPVLRIGQTANDNSRNDEGGGAGSSPPFFLVRPEQCFLSQSVQWARFLVSDFPVSPNVPPLRAHTPFLSPSKRRA